MASVSAPSGETLSYTYDGSLPLSESWIGVVNGTVSLAYNNDFNLASTSINGANTISRTYDADGLPVSVGNLAITRSPQNGFITQSTLGNAVTTYGYSLFGELASERTTANGTILSDTQYTHDKLGRITKKVETVGGAVKTFDYLYDLGGRLTQVLENGVVSASYTYDANGNRTAKTTATVTASGTYDNQDRMVSYGNAAFTYSANGELLTKMDGTGATSYQYDVLGNLLSVLSPNGTLIEYVVDGANRRVGKKVNGVLVQGWLYSSQLAPIAELDGAGNVVSVFVYGAKANIPDYVIKNGVSYRIISDHLGSPRLVVDSTSGTIIQKMDFDEFGIVVLDSNPGFIPFGFAGGLYDRDTGLVRFGARDYEAQSGRWTSKDPIRFQGGDTNLYGYVLGDTVNFVDGDGFEVKYAVGVTPPTDKRLLDILDKLDEMDPEHDVCVTSGLRSQEKQERIRTGSGSGAKVGQHVLGKAVDVKMPGKTPAEVADIAKRLGATGTVTYNNNRITHINVRDGTPYHARSISGVGR